MNFFGHFNGKRRAASSGAPNDDAPAVEHGGYQRVVMQPFDFENPRFLRYLSTMSPAIQTGETKLMLDTLISRLQGSFQRHKLTLPTLGSEVDYLTEILAAAKNDADCKQKNHDAVVLLAFALINNARFIPPESIATFQTLYTCPDYEKGLPTIDVRLEPHSTGVCLNLYEAGSIGRFKRLDIPKGTDDAQCANFIGKLFHTIEQEYRFQTHKQRHLLASLKAAADNLGDCVLVPRAFAELREDKTLRVIPELARIIEQYANPCVFNQKQVRRMRTAKPVCKVLANTLYFDQLEAKQMKQARKKQRVL